MSTGKRKKILCVFTRVLGWNIYIQYVYEALDKIARIHTKRIEFGHQDVFDLTPPKLFQISNDLDGIWRMNKYAKLKNIRADKYDGMIFQGYQLAVPFMKIIKSTPTALITDTTPMMADKGNTKVDGLLKRLFKSIYIPIMHSFIYKPLFSSIDCFFVLSETVKNSLIDTYGICDTKIYCVNPPLFGREYKPFKQNIPKSNKPRLLFIGNDFSRKGGDFLMSLYKKNLYKIADLIVISNDIRLDNIHFPENVYHYKNIPHEEILGLLRKCDLFLFPTYKDELGLVLCEAISAGLPVVSRDASSQGEYVISHFNGELMSYESGEQEWIEVITKIIIDTELMRKYKSNSLILAKQKLDISNYQSTFDDALNSMGI